MQRGDDLAHRQLCQQIMQPGAKYHFCLIGGPIFSAGAGGSADLAPSPGFRGSGCAGWSAGVVGRASPGLDSAGLLLRAGAGVPCKGGVPGVLCTRCCRPPTFASAKETPDIASSATISAKPSSRSPFDARIRLSVCISFNLPIAATIATGRAGQCSGRSAQSSSSPALPSSSEKASSVPLAFQASAETAAVPFRRTRISAPSSSRTIRTVPSP